MQLNHTSVNEICDFFGKAMTRFKVLLYIFLFYEHKDRNSNFAFIMRHLLPGYN